MSEAIQFPITQITRDPRLQTRAHTVNPEHVERLRYAIAEGHDLPPIELAYDGQQHYLKDGWNRTEAYGLEGALNIPAIVVPQTFREALWDALTKNADHGLPRTNEDKRRVVTIALGDSEWQGKSDRALADHCRVSHEFVRRLRAEMFPPQQGGQGQGQVSTVDTSSGSTRVGRDGKAHPSSKPTKKQPFVPTIEQLEQSASQKLTGDSLERELLAWAGQQLEGEYKPVELVVLLERRDALSLFKGHLENLRKLFDEKEVKTVIVEVALRNRREMEAARDEAKNALEKSTKGGNRAENVNQTENGQPQTLLEFAQEALEGWLEERQLDQRNLTLAQVYQFAADLAIVVDEHWQEGWDFGQMGAVVAELASSLVDPPTVTPETIEGTEPKDPPIDWADTWAHVHRVKLALNRLEGHDEMTTAEARDLSVALNNVLTEAEDLLKSPPNLAPSSVGVDKVIRNRKAKPKISVLGMYIRDFYKKEEPNGSPQYWAGWLEEHEVWLKLQGYFMDCGYLWVEGDVKKALEQEIAALRKEAA